MIKTSQTKPSMPDMQQLNVSMRSLDVEQWKYVVSRISNPTTAKIIVDYLDSDPAARLQFAGVYVRARETVQQSRIRYAKAKQWGERFGRLMAWVSKTTRRLPTNTSVEPSVKGQEENRQPLIWPALNVNI